MKYTVLKSWQSNELKESRVIEDHVISLDGVSAARYEDKKMRLIRIWDSIKNMEYEFLTNHFQWKVTTVAALYKEHWEIETFFKHLREYRLHPDLDSTDRDITLQIHSETGEIWLEPVQSSEFYTAEHLRED